MVVGAAGALRKPAVCACHARLFRTLPLRAACAKLSTGWPVRTRRTGAGAIDGPPVLHDVFDDNEQRDSVCFACSCDDE